jgi:hypothetical protein
VCAGRAPGQYRGQRRIALSVAGALCGQASASQPVAEAKECRRSRSRIAPRSASGSQHSSAANAAARNAGKGRAIRFPLRELLSRLGARQPAQLHVLSLLRAQARAKQLSRVLRLPLILGARATQHALAPKRASSTSAVCPEPKRAVSLGRIPRRGSRSASDQDLPTKRRPTNALRDTRRGRTDRTGACDASSKGERPNSSDRR